MPRTGRYNSPGLSIEVDDFQATYLPGDILTGWVTYTKPLQPDQATPYIPIRLKLFGRAKSKYTVKTHSGTKIARGRAILFDITKPLSINFKCQTPGEHAWPFQITIPTTSQPGLAQRSGDEWKPHVDGYLATRDDNKNPIDVTKHPLPSIMYYHGASSMSGKTSEAYVEYVLLAQAGRSTATLPLFLRQKGTPSPITDHRAQTRSDLQLVRSPKLLLEHADKELTFRQKSSRFFKPSKTPRYAYSVKVEYPTVIQLEHPDSIPLKIAIVPDLDPQKTTIGQVRQTQNLPPVNLTSISLKLKMCIDIRCPGMFWDSDNDKYHDFYINFPDTLNPFPIPVVPESAVSNVMAAPDTNLMYLYHMQHQGSFAPLVDVPASEYMAPSVNSNNVSLSSTLNDQYLIPKPYTPANTLSCPSSLHLGERYGIYLGCSAYSSLGRKPISFKRQMYPTFTTYNIRLRYTMKWKFGLECAGEVQEVSGTAPVTIIAPSEEQEAQKKRELGTEGMKKNYDDLQAGVGVGLQFIGQVLQAVT